MELSSFHARLLSRQLQHYSRLQIKIVIRLHHDNLGQIDQSLVYRRRGRECEILNGLQHLGGLVVSVHPCLMDNHPNRRNLFFGHYRLMFTDGVISQKWLQIGQETTNLQESTRNCFVVGDKND